MEVVDGYLRSEDGSAARGHLEPAKQAAHQTGLSFEDLRVDTAGKVAVAIVVAAPRRVDSDSACAPIHNKKCD